MGSVLRIDEIFTVRCAAGLGATAVALLLFVPAFSCAADGPPVPGLHAYTHGHAMHADPPDRLGGALKVEVTQKDGSTRFVLPGPRFLDPSSFGTPANPVGFDPAPFPLLGTPLDMRNTAGDKYTFANHATPFSNWREVGVGSIKMKLVDQTAIDGARTKDKIDFEATFKAPDGSDFKVVCNKPLPHGMAYPFFGGVVTNQLMHGATGIGTRLMPTEFSYAAFWGVGDIYKNGKLINKDHLIHVMVTEVVRGDNYKLQFDGGVGNPPQGVTLHLMVPPFKPTPKGLVPDPLRTGFIPFPFVKKHMEEVMAMVAKMPEKERKAHMGVLKQIKELMGHTKEHVMAEMKAGHMDGQPFFHVMFGNIKMKAS